MQPVETLVDALALAARNSTHRGIAIFDRRAHSFERRTYAQLLDAIKLHAKRLAEVGIAPGDRVLISLPTSWPLIENYLGSIFLGAYPVLIAPGGVFGRGSSYAEKLSEICEFLTPRQIICEESTRNELAHYNQRRTYDRSILAATLSQLNPASTKEIFRPSPDGLAFIQLSSGSTGRQRAIQITHRSACHNAIAIGNALNCKPYSGADIGVSWLPLHHDMGLVGCLLFSILHGFDLWLLKPETFLAKPLAWLHVMSETNATLTTAPNFAYQTCVDRIQSDQIGKLDLSRLRAQMIGAEMVRADTCQSYVQKFASSRVDPKSMVACYGLAEATLAVAFDSGRKGLRYRAAPNAPHAGDIAVCNGKPVLDTAVQICPPSRPGDKVPDGVVGEVLVKGPGVFAGYYKDPAATQATMHQGWLRTGDLGFMFRGELYLTGRTKEMFIIRGRNVMPHEIEWLAERELNSGGTERAGAFAISKDGTEQVVLVVELPSTFQGTISEYHSGITERIGATMGLVPADLVFVKRGQIPKTTSGKVQRQELRTRYLAGDIDRL